MLSRAKSDVLDLMSDFRRVTSYLVTDFSDSVSGWAIADLKSTADKVEFECLYFDEGLVAITKLLHKVEKTVHLVEMAVCHRIFFQSTDSNFNKEILYRNKKTLELIRDINLRLFNLVETLFSLLHTQKA